MASYPGDYDGPLDLRYAPETDGQPDPGEVVWAHVPFEEDFTRGKDRPVLVVGRDGRWVLGMQLTSKDHDRDAAQEERAGRFWVDVGVGGWDGARRPSEVRVNRVVRIDPATIRREGAVLDPARWEDVVAAHTAHPHPQTGGRGPAARRVPDAARRPSPLRRLLRLLSRR
ncbi:type II toxin-antitoxin system PemK/MazF family toxin [Knoellia sp. CPCC 206450]|uniref:type II toxin-antitoxin system PemK/MazF family toxin n=1 Tax=Knoellia tibetensis TaxID=3404798 RepID=UPI003B436898